MFAKILRLLIPSEDNNHRAKVLSHSALSFYISLVVLFQIGMNILAFVNPNVLGFATNISVDDVLRVTNQKRAENGLKPVQLNASLSQAAAAKANDMFANNYWAHISPAGKTPWDFIIGSGYFYVYAGENLAKDFMDSDGVVAAWMVSPSHRENLLNPKYQEMGLAVVNGRLNGVETTLVVQIFGTRQPRATASSEESTTSLQEKQVAGSFAPSSEVEQMGGVKKEISGGPIIVNNQSAKPTFNIFGITKNFSIIVVLFILLIIAIDMVVISQKRVIRFSGNSFFHFSFLLFLLIIIILTSAGKIM